MVVFEGKHWCLGWSGVKRGVLSRIKPSNQCNAQCGRKKKQKPKKQWRRTRITKQGLVECAGCRRRDDFEGEELRGGFPEEVEGEKVAQPFERKRSPRRPDLLTKRTHTREEVKCGVEGRGRKQAQGVEVEWWGK